MQFCENSAAFSIKKISVAISSHRINMYVSAMLANTARQVLHLRVPWKYGREKREFEGNKDTIYSPLSKNLKQETARLLGALSIAGMSPLLPRKGHYPYLELDH